MRLAARMGAWGKAGATKQVAAAPAPSPFPAPAPAAPPSSAPSSTSAPAPAPKQGAKSKNCCLAQLLNTLAITDPTTKPPHSACAFGASCRFFHLVKGVHTKQDFEAGVQTISTGKKPVLSGAILKKVTAAVLTRDSHKAARAGFSLERMVREEHDSKAHDRLSHARINSLLGSEGQGGGRRDGRENRDWERLHRLVDGARVLVDEDFAPNNRAPPLRSLYRRVSKAVHKLLLELWKEEKVFIVTKDVAAKLGALHYSPTHWARKAGKVLGRNIFDASDGKFSTPLNTKTVKAMVRECYGDIRHPTIDEIVRMVMDFARDKQQELGEGFRWEDLRMWKADLRGAFTLLNYHADDVRLMACELTGDLVCIYHTGQFGWTGMPFAFDIITRTLRKLVRSVIRGRMTMYVDDMIAVCMAWDLEHDKGQAKAVSEGLLGSKAIADDKWADGTRLDVIGWTVDLTQRLVTIARKNFLKTLYGFFEVDLSRPVQVRTLKRLASWRRGTPWCSATCGRSARGCITRPKACATWRRPSAWGRELSEPC